MPCGYEVLDTITPQYISDLISWGAIGARTTESQIHRQLASGLSMPIGFKNGTGGTIQIACDAIVAARNEHVFLGIDDNGMSAIVKTTGNPAGHLILRGGKTGPNYDASSVASAQKLLTHNDLLPNLIIDCSHGNSNKDHRRQPIVLKDILRQRMSGNIGIVGIMLESHLFEGNQTLVNDPSSLTYGVSITDACINWEETESLINKAYSELGE